MVVSPAFGGTWAVGLSRQRWRYRGMRTRFLESLFARLENILKTGFQGGGGNRFRWETESKKKRTRGVSQEGMPVPNTKEPSSNQRRGGDGGGEATLHSRQSKAILVY